MDTFFNSPQKWEFFEKMESDIPINSRDPTFSEALVWW